MAGVAELATEVLRRPALAGRCRLVLVEGRAGAGKTHMAGVLATRLRRHGTVTVVAMDDLYRGWHDLPTVGRFVHHQVVGPLVAGTRPRVSGWDWERSRPTEPRPVPPADVVLVEGVGSWSRPLDPWISLLVWVQAPDDRRKARALARDGAVFAAHWDAWAADEVRVHRREGTRPRADVEWPG